MFLLYFYLSFCIARGLEMRTHPFCVNKYLVFSCKYISHTKLSTSDNIIDSVPGVSCDCLPRMQNDSAGCVRLMPFRIHMPVQRGTARTGNASSVHV